MTYLIAAILLFAVTINAAIVNNENVQIETGENETGSMTFGITGKITTINHIRYIGAIRSRTYNSTIGSVILLNNHWALTAASNVWEKQYDPKGQEVRFGSSNSEKGGIVIPIEKHIKHPGYDNGFGNDIALVKLSEKIEYSTTVHNIHIASKIPKSGKKVSVSGFGHDSATCIQGDLATADVVFLRSKKCKPLYAGRYDVKNTNICTTGKGKTGCSGESGSPLVHHNKLIGVYAGTLAVYGQVDLPEIYTDITKYRKWIKETTAKN